MKKKNFTLTLGSIFVLMLLLGISYAFYNYIKTGDDNSVLVAGDIYMHYTETNQINISNAMPMSKDEALKANDNVFNFQVVGKNTSSKDIYYGISLAEGESVSGKTTRIKPEDINVYLTSGDDILLDAVRYDSFNVSNIWVDTIPARTTNEITKNYSLRVWIDENTLISDTDPNADYTTEEWNNSYVSLKVNVNGNLNEMNMPLSLENDKNYVENGKSYFIAKVSNYINMNEAGVALAELDEMNLQIGGTNSDVLFSYKDSEGNEETTPSETLDLTYLFEKNKTVEVQVFTIPKNDANGSSDVSVTLKKNDNLVYSLIKRVDVVGNNYCLNNGFNKLTDCLLVTENLASDVEEAKNYISTKTYNLNDTAPSYTYVENITYDVKNPSYAATTGYKYYFGDGIEFDSETGTYKLTGTIITDNLSSSYIGKYTCGTTNYSSSLCGNVVKILEVDDTTSKITKADTYTYKIASTLRSEVGLYKTTDDYGDTYFFRGDVENNNVYFAGYYWKIIRMNGDNTIRLIYNGETPNATGDQTGVNNTAYTYSRNYGDGAETRYADPTYVGYMYGENFSDTEITSPETGYNNFGATTKYYFATDYTWNETTRSYTLKEEGIMYKTVKEMNDDSSFATNMYTCIGVNKTNCQIIIKVNSYVNETQLKVQYKSYSSVDVEGTRTNEENSNVKQILDTWYETNIKNKTDEEGRRIESYISDGTFCNDRSITSGDGFSLAPTTTYSAYNRLYANSKKSATLKCNSDIRDKFSTTSKYGNAKLTYPVALITADEVALAGGKYNMKNSDYYLRTNGYYWTMTPSYFTAGNAYARMYIVHSAGDVYHWSNVHHSFGVRAVINLRSDILISGGEGTTENPYILTY